MLAHWLEWLAWDLRILSYRLLVTELTPGGVDSACHPAEVGEMSISVLLQGHSISGTVTP